MKTCHLLVVFFAFAAVLVAQSSSSSSLSDGTTGTGIDLTPNNCTRITLRGVSCLQCEPECVRRHPDGVGYCTPKPTCECAYNCYKPPAMAPATTGN